MPSNRGVSLLYVILIISILLVVSFGLSRIIIPQVKMLKKIGYSVAAFYAADSGIERALVDRQNPNLTYGYYNGELDNGATYKVNVSIGGSYQCPADFMYCIKSTGDYRNTKRAIEVNY